MEVNKFKDKEQDLYRDSNKEVFVIGIGGVSRAGKSSVARYLKKELKIDVDNYFQIDRYLTQPIRKYDSLIEEFIEDWEDPVIYDLSQFYKDLKNRIEFLNQNSKNEIKIIIAEGFLLYNSQDISDLIDIKILLDIDKEVARSRRKSTKSYPSDYYFDEYIWKGWINNK